MEAKKITEEEAKLIHSTYEKVFNKAEDIPFIERFRLLNSAPLKLCTYLSEQGKSIEDLEAYAAVAARNEIAELRKVLAANKAHSTPNVEPRTDGEKTPNQAKNTNEKGKKNSPVRKKELAALTSPKEAGSKEISGH